MTDKKKDGCCGGTGGDSCGCSSDKTTTQQTQPAGACCGGGHSHDLSAEDVATINRILGDIDDDLDTDKDLTPEEVEALKKVFKMTDKKST